MYTKSIMLGIEPNNQIRYKLKERGGANRIRDKGGEHETMPWVLKFWKIVIPEDG